MTERYPSLRDPHLEGVGERYPIEGSPEKRGARGAVAATIIQTYGFICSGEPEGY
jgi:hypothetical protein